MKNNTPWILLAIILILTVGAIILVFTYGGSTSPVAKETIAPDITSADWTQGKKDATVSVIEYGDFQCPACGAYFPLVKQLIADYGDRVLFVFRNFPLYGAHQNAEISAKAAEAAGMQGKFWEMLDKLYTNQADWSLVSTNSVVEKYFAKYAGEIGIDIGKFNQDINSDQVKNKIKTDVDGANSAQVDHTPTFFVNLKQIPNPQSDADFKSIIENALKAS